MVGIPVHDDGWEEVEAGYAVVLVLAGLVADFALVPDAEGVLEDVVGLTLVEDGVWLGAACRRRAASPR